MLLYDLNAQHSHAPHTTSSMTSSDVGHSISSNKPDLNDRVLKLCTQCNFISYRYNVPGTQCVHLHHTGTMYLVHNVTLFYTVPVLQV